MNLYETLCLAADRNRSIRCLDFLRISSPGTRFDAETIELITDKLCTFTDELYGTDTSFYWKKKGLFDHLSDLWICSRNGLIIGVAGVSYYACHDEKIIYVDNINVSSRTKVLFGQSIGATLVYEIISSNMQKPFQKKSFVFRTQNQHVYRLGYSILPSGIYPRIDDTKPRKKRRHLKIGRFMSEQLSPGKSYETETSVIRKAYGSPIYNSENTSIRSREANVQRFWEESLNVEEGDAVLISVCPTALEVALAGLWYRFLLFTNRIFVETFSRKRRAS